MTSGQSYWCRSRGGRPGLLDVYSPYGLCGRKATLEEEDSRSDSFNVDTTCHPSTTTEPRKWAGWALTEARRIVLLLSCNSQQLVLWTLSLWPCSGQLSKEQVVEYTSCFAVAADVPNTLKCMFWWWWRPLSVQVSSQVTGRSAWDWWAAVHTEVAVPPAPPPPRSSPALPSLIDRCVCGLC